MHGVHHLVDGPSIGAAARRRNAQPVIKDKQHPAAVRLVKPPVKHKAAATSAHRKVAKRPVVHKTTAPPLVTATSHSSKRLLIWLAVITGLLFGGVAALPHGLIRRAGFLTTVGERELRIGALGAGAAVLLGVIVATLAS